MEKERVQKRIDETIKAVIVFLLGLVGFTAGSCCARVAFAEPIKIAIIDTGYDASRMPREKLKLCPTGHYNFATGKAEVGLSSRKHGPLHGTAIASIIADELKDYDYCAIVIQVDNDNGQMLTANIAKAFVNLLGHKVTYINASFAGELRSDVEEGALKSIIASGAKIFVPIGNTDENGTIRNLTKRSCARSYPACYQLDGVEIVGALKDDRLEPAEYSHRGDVVTQWYTGRVPQGFTANLYPGTSFSVPRALVEQVISNKRAGP